MGTSFWHISKSMMINIIYIACWHTRIDRDPQYDWVSTPRFPALSLSMAFLAAEVFRIGWYAGHYDAPTPKPHKGWCNNARFKLLDKGKFIWKDWHSKQKGKSKVVTVQQTISKNGKKSYAGTDRLKDTQRLGFAQKTYGSCDCWIERQCLDRWVVHGNCKCIKTDRFHFLYTHYSRMCQLSLKMHICASVKMVTQNHI